MNLKEQLEAKKVEAAKVDAQASKAEDIAAVAGKAPTESEIEAVIQAAEAINTLTLAAKSTKPAEKQPEPDYSGPQFRKGSFAYQFKYSKGTIKCDKAGVYTPQTAEEFEILKHQVLRGNILFN